MRSQKNYLTGVERNSWKCTGVRCQQFSKLEGDLKKKFYKKILLGTREEQFLQFEKLFQTFMTECNPPKC